jgi:hypothetical protein
MFAHEPGSTMEISAAWPGRMETCRVTARPSQCCRIQAQGRDDGLGLGAHVAERSEVVAGEDELEHVTGSGWKHSEQGALGELSLRLPGLGELDALVEPDQLTDG